MTAQYKTCIIGLTGIGAGAPQDEEGHGFGVKMPTSHARSYALLPETHLVGVCDLKEELVDEFKTAWADELPDVKGFSDFREMISECRPDILSIVTSDNRHADIVVHAAESGIKGMFCEKPIATNLADADRMIRAIEANGVVVNVNHSRRWIPHFRIVKQCIKDGAIGTLGRIVLHFGGPRAIIFRNGTHMIDMICYLADSDPAWVFAELDDGYEDYWPYQGDGGRNPDLEPGASGYIHFRNGVRAFYNGSKGFSPETGLQLIGTEGMIWVDDEGASLTTESGSKKLRCDPVSITNAGSAIREIIRGMEDGSPVLSPPREARKTLEIILGFLASQKLGNSRVNFPFDETKI